MAHTLFYTVVNPVWRTAQDVLIHRCRYCPFHDIQHPLKAVVITLHCCISDTCIHFRLQHGELILQICSLQFNYATVLPEQLQSPLLTAEWEHRLKEIECGELGADEFLAGIRDMVAALVRDAAPVDGAEVLFPSGRPVVGKCPRCGAEVTESKNGYFCERRSCKFGLWRDNRFLAAKKISLTKKMASSLLTQGRAYASGIYSEKTGKTYDAFIVLEDDGARSSYKLDFTK